MRVPSLNKLTQKRLIMGTPAKSKKKRTQRDYSMGFKLALVCQVEKGEMTYNTRIIITVETMNVIFC